MNIRRHHGMKTFCWAITLLLGHNILIQSCQKDSLDTSSKQVFQFSTDTLHFDTVFQTLGSATRSFRIYNKTNNSLMISSVNLFRGSSSQFRFNIDGNPSTTAQNINILPNDSAWVFVEVTVNPTVNSLLVRDSLIIESNGGKQYIILQAYGQNAYYHKGEIISSNTLWKNDKPHVILSNRTSSGTIPGAVISSGARLTIESGAKLHFGSSAGLIVQGSIQCIGTATNKIFMRGVRLEKPYLRAAGQWLGILIERNSRNNIIEHTIIDETAFGIWMGFQATTNFSAMTDASRADIIIRASTIRNGYYWTLRSLNNKVTAENCEFYTSIDETVQLYLGGDYRFTNCTIFNIQSEEKKSNLIVSNQIYDDATKQTYKNKLSTVQFENCLLHSNTDESFTLILDTVLNPRNQIVFSHCLYNSQTNLKGPSFSNCIIHQNPLFVNTTIDQEDLKLKAGSPAIDKGITNSLTTDISNKPRPNGSSTDIGANEF